MYTLHSVDTVSDILDYCIGYHCNQTEKTDKKHQAINSICNALP